MIIIDGEKPFIACRVEKDNSLMTRKEEMTQNFKVILFTMSIARFMDTPSIGVRKFIVIPDT